MPSQEEYLDNLLKDITAQSAEQTNGIDKKVNVDGADIPDKTEFIGEAESGKIMNSTAEAATVMEEAFRAGTDEEETVEGSDEAGQTIDIESTKNLSEEDIERLLSFGQQSANGGEAPDRSVETPEEDLMEMLESEENQSLQEIQDLLQKADNNEAVDDGIIELLQENSEEKVFDPEIFTGGESSQNEEAADNKEDRAAQRRQKREEKKALKAAKREAIREKKEAKKAEKREGKNSAVENKAESVSENLTENAAEVPGNPDIPEPVMEETDLSDIEELLNFTGQLQDLQAPKTASAELAGKKEDNRLPEEQLADTLPTGEPLPGDISDISNIPDIPDIPDISDVLDHEKKEDSEGGETVDTAEKKKSKKGIFSKLFTFLTEEEEEEPDSEEIQLSDENKNILQELDKEKNKKKKGKKGKKGKTEETAEAAADGEETEEDSQKEKPRKGKEKKEKKAKKEKTPKVAEADAGGKKLTIKKILPVALLCLTLGMVIILTANIFGGYSAKMTAKEAYYQGDYQTCYQNLFGKDLDETERVMLGKSESILRIRLWIREYEVLKEEGSEAEALDSLIQSVNEYPTLFDYSTQWNAHSEVEELYAQILEILSSQYHLSQEQALEIAATENDADYSKKIYAIVEGNAYGSWEQQEEQIQQEPLLDVLPEEDDLGDISFVENISE